MPLYHINVTFGERRDVIVVDHVLEEYGISEQTFFSTWLGSDKRIQGDGDTFEEAIKNLFNNFEMKKMLANMQDELFNIKGTTNWYQTELQGLDAQLRAANG